VRSLLPTAAHANSRGTRAKGDALEAMASEADLARMAAMSAEIEELSERRVSTDALKCCLEYLHVTEVRNTAHQGANSTLYGR
jgi:hypothetical protein